MLEKLILNNVALITNLEIDFTSGFNILTGETGSGKSIIIDGLNFVLGERADKTLIRNGTDCMKVQAVFSNISNVIKEKFNDIDFSDDVLIISRTINLSGKSECKVNGEIVTSNTLKEITSYLVDIFGQNEHQSLLQVSKHIDILDSFIDNEKLSNLKNELKINFDKLNDVNSKLKDFIVDPQKAQTELEILQFQINEIEKADIKDGEYEDLENQKKLMVNSEKIAKSLNSSSKILEGEGNYTSIDSLIFSAKRELQSVQQYDKSIEDLASKLEDVNAMLSDIIDSIHNLSRTISYDEDKLDSIVDRIDIISSLKRKYGNSFEEIMNYKSNAEKKYDDIINSSQKINQLNNQKNEILKVIYAKCFELSSLRKIYAKKLEDNITKELLDLGMKNSKFVISFNKIDDSNIGDNISINGFDKIEFMFSANLGEDIKPLSKIISGGEMSRFMLAFKNVVANKDDINTLVFDEIDTGISGITGEVVAEKMSSISKSHQVLCITHLPQIACMGDRNFLIQKYNKDNSTITETKILNEDDLIKEISRLTGSASLTDLSYNHAKEMREKALSFKKTLN
jgi:DNA repair protein RecN (Recombination protein N)